MSHENVDISPIAEAAAKAFTKPFGKRWIYFFKQLNGGWSWGAFDEDNNTVSRNFGFKTKSKARKAAELEYQGWELEFVEEQVS